jgi:Fur family transcriptional regulator, iron response regulator
MNFRLAHIMPLLHGAGLRPTRHRVALARLLFDRETTRHVTAEQLFAEALAANISLSLATVYNILNQFTAAGLLREINIDSKQTCFDSNTTPHHHIVSYSRNTVTCLDIDAVRFSHLPTLPEGDVIDHIDVVIWTRSIKDA